MTAMIEWETLDENELREVINHANYWLDQLTRKQQIVDLLAELNPADPDKNGQPWVQPSGAHDAYGLGAEAVHKGRLWESAHPFNVWEPGTGDLWIDRGEASTPDPLPVDGYPVWEPWIAVKVGDPYVHDGILYTAIQAHTTQAGWEPPAVPALWKKVG